MATVFSYNWILLLEIEVRLNCDIFRQWYPEGCSETRTIVAVSHHSQPKINESN